MKLKNNDAVKFAEGILKDATPSVKRNMLSLVAALQEAAWILDPQRIEERLRESAAANDGDAGTETETEPDGAEE